MNTRRTLLAGLLLAAFAPPARAQKFGVELEGGYSDLTGAQRSAQAAFGSSGSGTFGGALRYVHRKGFYLAGGARSWSKDGERVFAASATGPVQHLGFPLSVRLVPVTGTVGYRFRRDRAFVPFVGIGGGVTLYREESDVTGDVRSESRSAGTFLGEAGVEYGRGRFRYALEGSYSIASGGVGVAGISEVYGEDDLGGWAVLGKVVYTFGRRGPAKKDPQN
jgi:Outer membrane protein beta-barrel domain